VDYLFRAGPVATGRAGSSRRVEVRKDLFNNDETYHNIGSEMDLPGWCSYGKQLLGWAFRGEALAECEHEHDKYGYGPSRLSEAKKQIKARESGPDCLRLVVC